MGLENDDDENEERKPTRSAANKEGGKPSEAGWRSSVPTMNSTMFVLVGTKAEVVLSSREVTTEEALQTAMKWDIPYIEVSAKEPQYYEHARFLAQLAASVAKVNSPVPTTTTGGNTQRQQLAGEPKGQLGTSAGTSGRQIPQRVDISSTSKVGVRSPTDDLPRQQRPSHGSRHRPNNVDIYNYDESESEDGSALSDELPSTPRGAVSVQVADVYAARPVDGLTTQCSNAQLVRGLDTIVEKTAAVGTWLAGGRSTIHSLFDSLTSRIARVDGI
eukprot:TRINITY_DN24716_c0_g1_i1.p1 TRINITY_DN24716_c0_g1~~TRINITY_DN24716_c0_g1_i1.p1  ORF type:complete len:274 (-),score=6.84 TRINITY_DN24716_c0_g1_i1:156-977(-)